MQVAIKNRLLIILLILMVLLIKSFIDVPDNIELNLVVSKSIHTKPILSKYNPENYRLPLGKATFKIDGLNYFQKWLAPKYHQSDNLKLIFFIFFCAFLWVYTYKNKLENPSTKYTSLVVKILAYCIILYSFARMIRDGYYSILVNAKTDKYFTLDYDQHYINQNIWACVFLFWISKMYKQADLLEKENALTI